MKELAMQYIHVIHIVRHFVFIPTFFILFLFFIFPVSALAQGDPVLHAPDTLQEAKEGTVNIGNKIGEALPGVITGIWNTQVIPVWKKMEEWTKTEVWEKRVLPVFQALLDRAKELLGQEIEKKRPIIEQQLEQEKQELKESIKQAGKDAGKGLPRSKAGLWERFWALFSARNSIIALYIL